MTSETKKDKKKTLVLARSANPQILAQPVWCKTQIMFTTQFMFVQSSLLWKNDCRWNCAH